MTTTPLQIVGAGPAGMCLILALANRIAQSPSRRANVLFNQLVMFEAASKAGGLMGHYQINANTNSPDVVEGIHRDSVFHKIREQYLSEPETTNPLIKLSRIETLMIQPLAALLKETLGSRLRLSCPVSRVNLDKNGFHTYDSQGRLLGLSENLVFCCGGQESLLPILSSYRHKTVMSDDFLLRKKVDDLELPAGPVVIIGASHSAFSCIWRLLNDPLFEDFRGREIIMLQRRQHIKIRCTPEFAAEYRIPYDDVKDVGKAKGLVYAHAGLRKDAKWLYLNIRDGHEKRVKVKQIQNLENELDVIKEAGLILQATGSKANLPDFQINNEVTSVGQPTKTCELTREGNQQIIPGLFGYGLGFNIVPEGRAGGEDSFTGGIHGFQSYQQFLSPIVIEKILNRVN